LKDYTSHKAKKFAGIYLWSIKCVSSMIISIVLF